jgi:hypothetical protein
VSCLWLVCSSHASCFPTRREVCKLFATDVVLLRIDRLWGDTSFPVNARLFPSCSVPKFRKQKRDTSFRENLGTFQLRRDPAKVASRFVTVDFYFKLSSAPASWSRLSPLQPRPKKRERGLEDVGQRPCKPLVAFCRRGEWVALISPEGLFGELAFSLISRLGPEFQTLFETLVL